MSGYKEFIHTVFGSRDKDVFPGSHPVSIERRHFPILKNNEYVVCEKTDGIRHLLTCFMDGDRKMCYLVNRKLEASLVTFCIPRNTLLDGELVDVHGEKYFMIFDGLMVNGVDIQKQNYIDRLKAIEPITKGPSKGIKLRMKTMWPLSAIGSITPSIDYETDGFILNPVNEPVRMETHETMFKLKPLASNTIDFKVMYNNGVYGLYVWDRGGYVYEGVCVEGEKYVNEIVECCYQAGHWYPVKIRSDKGRPNNRRTFYRTLVNIREDIHPSEIQSL
jgi:hypothetical protein